MEKTFVEECLNETENENTQLNDVNEEEFIKWMNRLVTASHNWTELKTFEAIDRYITEEGKVLSDQLISSVGDDMDVDDKHDVVVLIEEIIRCFGRFELRCSEKTKEALKNAIENDWSEVYEFKNE